MKTMNLAEAMEEVARLRNELGVVLEQKAELEHLKTKLIREINQLKQTLKNCHENY